jgi:uncharacterized protein (TIGR03382 family)
MSIVLVAAVLSTFQANGFVTPGNGDYVDVPFTVPAGTVEIQITKTYNNDNTILDFGVWSPSGYRGWSGGLLADIVVGAAQSSRGYLPGDIETGTWTVTIGKANVPVAGVAWTINITCNDTATLPVVPTATWQDVVLENNRRWYKGDFHVHDSQSGDSLVTQQQDVDLASSRGLDFIHLADHNTVSQHAMIAAEQPYWPVLVMRGSEVTTYSGHGNAVGIHDYVDHRIGHDGRTMANVITDVAAQGGIFIVNHAAYNLGTACIGCGWQHWTDVPWDMVSGIEIITSNYDIGVLADTPPVIKWWDMLEDQGHRLAAVTGSDDHTAGVEGATGSPIGSPTSVVLADNLSEPAIMDAVRHQHTIAQLRGPTDPFVQLQMALPSGGWADVGDDVRGISHAEMEVHVTGGNGTFVTLWRNGEKIDFKPVTSDDFVVKFDDPLTANVVTRYRAELIDGENDRIVVTSHIYAHGVEESGCNAGGAGGAGGGVLVLLALVGVKRRRR